MAEYIESQKSKLQLLQKQLIEQAGVSLSSADYGKTQLKAEDERTRLSEEYLAIISGAYNEMKKNTGKKADKAEFFQINAIINFCKKSLDIIEVLNKLPLHKRRFKDRHAGKIMRLNTGEYDELFGFEEKNKPEIPGDGKFALTKAAAGLLKPRGMKNSTRVINIGKAGKVKKMPKRSPKNPRNEIILIRVNEDELKEAKALAREETNGNVSLFLRRLMVERAEKKEQKIYNIISGHERVIAGMNKMFPKRKRQKSK